jgi:hypothetical protein
MGVNGFVAVDDIAWVNNDRCETKPAWADPEATTTQEPPTSTTGAPTQPAFPACDFEEGECGWLPTQGPVRWTRVDDSQLAANNQTVPAASHGKYTWASCVTLRRRVLKSQCSALTLFG